MYNIIGKKYVEMTNSYVEDIMGNSFPVFCDQI